MQLFSGRAAWVANAERGWSSYSVPGGPQRVWSNDPVNATGSRFSHTDYSWLPLREVRNSTIPDDCGPRVTKSMKTESINEVVERVTEGTGIKRVQVKLRARMVSEMDADRVFRLRPGFVWATNSKKLPNLYSSRMHYLVRYND